MRKIAKGAYLTGSAADAFARAARREYERGKPIRAIMAESGRSYGAVHRTLELAGVRFRARGGPRHGRPAGAA